MAYDPTILPADLPVPKDDGACLHLRGAALPAIELPSTGGGVVVLDEFTREPCVLFFYPRTGLPGQPASLGFRGEEWDTIPGARGCTPQSCGFRDLHSEFARLGVRVAGVSTNTTAHQAEFKARMHVPFDFLSDHELRLTRGLCLPTFEFPVESGGPTTLLQRMAWFCEGGRIRHVWYPVFPPDRNAAVVLAWVTRRTGMRVRPIAPVDAEYVRGELTRHWGSPTIWSLGRSFQGDALPGFVADVDGAPAGLVTLHIHEGGYQGEVVTLSAARDSAGAGSRLLEAAEDCFREAECSRAFLTTTNDNLRAIGFYQRFGWRFSALHRGALDEARQRVPEIPRIGLNGIGLRDELEFERWLKPATAACQDASAVP